MRDEEFQLFLTRKYRGPRHGRPLSTKPSRDAVSRCRRIEEVLGLDLDTALPKLGLERVLDQVTSRAGSFRIKGDVGPGLTALRYSVRLYAAFLGVKERRKGRW